MRGWIGLLLMAAALLIGARPSPAAEEPACEARDPLRRVFWGDLHVHTGLSMDAQMFGTRLRPDDAYRFARGESLDVLRVGGGEPEAWQIERPLDFAAVTDHAMNFGGMRLCTTPGTPVYDSAGCRQYREPFVPGGLSEGVREIFGRMRLLLSPSICGADGRLCREAAADVWRETIESAERWNDGAPDCGFTTFVAYEYTATPEGRTKVHRNVIFRNATVPELPVSYADEPTAVGLWRQLRRQCLDAGTGCDALAIPHNPNLSNGQMFTIEYPEGSTREQQIELARLRAGMEPVVEMMQMKGDSECRQGMWNVLGSDELCDFEKLRVNPDPPDCRDGTGAGALAEEGCVSRLDYARYALIEGLREADRIGVNPYAFGLIAATDIHTGMPGPVEEHAAVPPTAQSAVPGMNPGGLAAVWAEENTREALFEALRRREVYGTSGPRMTVRLFGGWDYPDELCAGHDLARAGYAGGVPMGSDLPPRPVGAGAPVLAVSALRDPGTRQHPGHLLQRVQIVKGWAEPDGRFQQRVYDVAGDAPGAAGVDPATCQPRGPGAAALCGVWRDPEFDPARRAVYYARVLENPSCRYDGWACVRSGECPAGPALIQERAWTAPVWYAPLP